MESQKLDAWEVKLAYDYAILLFKSALRKFRSKGIIYDFIWISSDIGHSYIQWLAMTSDYRKKNSKSGYCWQRNLEIGDRYKN